MGMSSSAFRDLPLEILTEILLRLPVRSIIRFRLVCKSWRSLTSDPSFIEVYRRCGPTGTSIIMKLNEYWISDGRLDLYHIDAHRRTKRIIRLTTPMAVTSGWLSLCLMGSCDGLFCFKEVEDCMYMPRYHVCNLATKEWMAVPCSPHPPDVQGAFHLAMYYHWLSGEYRLLDRLYDDGSFTTGFQVFSLGGSNPYWTWRPLTGFFGDDALASAMTGAYPLQLAPAVSVCGCVHWLPTDILYNWIMAFDVEAEKFRKMSTPAGAEREYYHCAFEMKGSLGLSRIAPSDAMKMELWWLKDYQREEWAKLHTILLQSISRTLPYVESMRALRPLSIIGDGERNEVLFSGYLYVECWGIPAWSSSSYNPGSYNFFFVYDLEGEQTKDLKFDGSFDPKLVYNETFSERPEDALDIMTLWTQPLAYLLT